MIDPSTDAARDALAQLAARGIDWSTGATRVFTLQEGMRDSSVLILIGELDDVPAHATAAEAHVSTRLDVLLQRRSARASRHPGQVSFPGGGAEPEDVDAAATALREAVEETGLDPAGVEILGALPPVPLMVSKNLVTPVLAWWRAPSRVAAVDPREAVEVFRVPVADLLDPSNRATAVRPQHESTRIRTPAFEVDGVVVWGFTAFLLDRIFDELGWTVPYDASRTIGV